MTQKDVPGGYWLIENDLTSAVIASPRRHEFARSIFDWIACRVSRELDLPSRSIELTTIDAEYCGKYPCLAARKSSGPLLEKDAGDIIASIASTLHSVTVSELLMEVSRH
jgi:hypothetical protein